MKKIIYVLILLVTLTLSAFTQETNDIEKTSSKKGLTAPYFGVSIMFEGANYISVISGVKTSSKPQLIISPILDLKLGKEFFFLGQFGFSSVAKWYI